MMTRKAKSKTIPQLAGEYERARLEWSELHSAALSRPSRLPAAHRAQRKMTKAQDALSKALLASPAWAYNSEHRLQYVGV